MSPINCSGEQNCTISFSTSSVVTECQRKPSDYFYGNNFVSYFIIKDVVLWIIKIYLYVIELLFLVQNLMIINRITVEN